MIILEYYLSKQQLFSSLTDRTLAVGNQVTPDGCDSIFAEFPLRLLWVLRSDIVGIGLNVGVELMRFGYQRLDAVS